MFIKLNVANLASVLALMCLALTSPAQAYTWRGTVTDTVANRIDPTNKLCSLAELTTKIGPALNRLNPLDKVTKDDCTAILWSQLSTDSTALEILVTPDLLTFSDPVTFPINPQHTADNNYHVTIGMPGDTDRLTFDGQGQTRLFDMADNVTVAMWDIKYIRGKPKGGGNGGLILQKAGMLTIKNSEFRGGHAYEGGCIYSSGRSLAVVDTKFVDCSAENNSGNQRGGAISSGTNETHISGTILKPINRVMADDADKTRLDAKGSIFVDNRAGEGGGAVQIRAGKATVRGTLFLHNTVNFASTGTIKPTSQYGGGGYLDYRWHAAG